MARKKKKRSQKKPTRKRRGLRILVLNGPNLDRLGKREPEIYGRHTLADIETELQAMARERGHDVTLLQSNHEGDLIGWIGAAEDEGYSGILLNAASLTHTSIGLYDALKGTKVLAVEVHLSNPHARESFRHVSTISSACVGTIAGFRARSYTLALDALLDHLGG